MGNNESSIYLNQKPEHQVNLNAFWIDQTEVTNKQYAACVDAGVCAPPHYTGLPNFDGSEYYGVSEFDNYPVIYVNWIQARTYCVWEGRRLPTEAEWEKVARGEDKRTYPWGEGIDCSKANYTKSCVGITSSVGSYISGQSPYGAYDMAGNVWEWVADWYSDTFYQIGPFSNPLGPDFGEYRVMRGGSWDAYEEYADTTFRGGFGIAYPDGSNDIGFRCAMSATP